MMVSDANPSSELSDYCVIEVNVTHLEFSFSIRFIASLFFDYWDHLCFNGDGITGD